MHKIIVVSPAVDEPVTLDEARAQLRIKEGKDDAHIAFLLAAARDKVEKYCNRYFTAQTVKVVLTECLNSDFIRVPFPDVESIDQIVVEDSDCNLTTASDFSYNECTDLIKLNGLPSSTPQSIAITLTTKPPIEMSGVKIAILMILTDLYELRTESVIGFSIAKNPAVVNSLYPYRVNLGV